MQGFWKALSEVVPGALVLVVIPPAVVGYIRYAQWLWEVSG
jgi:hypothetical protein